MAYRNAILVKGSPLKLRLFGANCSSGRSYIIAPERWDTTWENNVKLARMADEVGLECMVPIARGAFCTIGDPDWVTGQLVRLHSVGFDGLVLNFVNYLDEFPYFAQEVLPRLERQGIRQKALTPARTEV